jgi:hypothetical protein
MAGSKRVPVASDAEVEISIQQLHGLRHDLSSVIDQHLAHIYTRVIDPDFSFESFQSSTTGPQLDAEDEIEGEGNSMSTIVVPTDLRDNLERN